jgi:hypothetical protein
MVNPALCDIIYTVAGGGDASYFNYKPDIATAVSIIFPDGISVDSKNNIYIAKQSVS